MDNGYTNQNDYPESMGLDPRGHETKFSACVAQVYPVKLEPVTLTPNSTTIFGRGHKWSISDRRISRTHGEFLVSEASKTVTFRSLHALPVAIFRHNQVISIKNSETLELKNFDEIRLLQGQHVFKVFINYGDSDMDCNTNGEDATQLDPDEILNFFKANKNKSAEANMTKRPSEDDGPSIKKTKTEGLGVLISPNEIKFIQGIGTGSVGEVYEASWRGTRVAVKRICRTLLRDNTLVEFESEADILRRLRHPNIVLFMGTSLMNNTDLCIITEFVARGSLHAVLRSNQTLPMETILKMATDSARGMNYLHTYTPPIIHRDLKSGNLLVDENYSVKVTDFGLAKFQTTERNSTFCGTLPWTAPEVFSEQGYTEKADIYSYAIVLWELMTREEPYIGLGKPTIIVGVTKEKLRPGIPANHGFPMPYVELMQACWHEHPEARPAFWEILEQLEALQNGPKNTLTRGVSLFSNNNHDNNNLLNTNMSVQVPTPVHLTQQFQQGQRGVLDQTQHAWEIQPQDLQFSSELAEGTISIVYSAQYQGRSVAVKILKEAVDGKHQQDFEKELEVLNQLRSPRVVAFYGACFNPRFAFVTELLKNGSLADVLTRPDLNIGWELVLNLCIDASMAVKTLHEWKPSIVHRDIRPQHFLVDDNFRVKISEFGLARFTTPSNLQTLAQLRTTHLYSAPETLKAAQFTTASDVFSLGIVVWELIHRVLVGFHQSPYYHLFENVNNNDNNNNQNHNNDNNNHNNNNNNQNNNNNHQKTRNEGVVEIQIALQVAQGERPHLQSGWPPCLITLVTECWAAEPTSRPNAATIVRRLEEVFSQWQEEQLRKLAETK